jgi:diaminopimelate epimerase
MKIPFTKAHGARNDFLLTWRLDLSKNAQWEDALANDIAMPDLARAICDRHTGVGADGWMIVSGGPLVSDGQAGADGSIQLWNSDGSSSEISGNGTRCAAAFLIEAGRAGQHVKIATGAGVKELTLLERDGFKFSLEMGMGRAVIEELRGTPAFARDTEAVPTLNDVTILNVGNPQCAVFVDDFDFDWRATGAWIEKHPRFPNRTNVSFVKVVDPHTLEVFFFERGAGETMSSGTGSTGAAAAAMARGLVKNPVKVITPAGPLMLRWEEEEIWLTGPAEISATGEFYL